MKRLIAILCAFLLAYQPLPSFAATTTFTADTTTNFQNPGRGFHFQSGSLDNCGGMDIPNWASDAAGLSTPISPAPTLNNVLTSLGSGVPSGGTLTTWTACFATARAAGVMFGLRFLSTGTAAQMVAQANAIATTLKANQDLIAYVQIGFRCDYAEWATGCTDNNNVADKTTVFNAVAAMVPTSIPLEFTQVYPRETWFGTTPPTVDDMKKGNLKGRTGTHTDCFLTGNGDSSFYTFVGTLTGFNSTMTAAQQAAYIQAASANTMFGGETCSDSTGATAQMRVGCTDSTDAQGLAGGILNEGPRYHVVHLNVDFARNFLASWSAGGCLTTVARSMGYRFQFDDITNNTSVTRGSTITFDVNMRNVGWARNFDQRRLHVIVKPSSGSDIDCAASTQLRELPSQATSSSTVRVSCAIPAGTATGTASLFLKMPSAFSTTQANAYTIRPANASASWDATNYRYAAGSITVN